jgi:predicted phage replisome organizer
VSVRGIDWVKLATDTFEDEKVLLIGAMPDGDTMVVLWVRLICMAGKVNAGGVVRLAEGVPFTDETLATVLHRPISTVRLAIDTFDRLGMVHLDEQGIWLTNWDKYQNVDGMERIRELARARKQRQRARMVAASSTLALPPAMSRDASRSVTQQSKREDTEQDKDTATASPLTNEVSRDSNSLLSELCRLPGWALSKDNHDAEWLSEFVVEFPTLTASTLKACRDYHSDKKRHSKGSWKLRIRHWMEREGNGHSPNSRRRANETRTYDATPSYDRPLTTS